MQVILKPTVTLIAKQVFLGHPNYEIPDDGSDAVKLGAFAAKTCYDSVGKNGRANVANQEEIIKHKHGSVLEHINYTVFVEGITRALSLESNRHRHLAVSQRSTRYTKEEDAAIVLDPYYAMLFEKYKPVCQTGKFWICPEKDPIQNYNGKEWRLLHDHLEASQQAIGEYRNQIVLLEELNPNKLEGFHLRKWARGKARNLLPHSLETRITYTGNVRAWRWFIESRTGEGAEPEIRRLAHEIYKVLVAEAPTYFGDFTSVPGAEIDGIPVLITPNSKI